MSDNSKAPVATAIVDMGATHYEVAIQTGTHRLKGDEPKPEGGDAGPSPFGLLLSSLGACTAITLRMYAERKQWPIEGVHVELTFRWEDEGRARAAIERRIRLDGALGADQRARMMEIAEKTPVTRAIKAGIAMATTLV